MADSSYNPFQGMLNPNMQRGANLWDLRMMSAANRMETPFEHGAGRSTYSRQGIGGNPMLQSLVGQAGEPDYSQFTYDPAMNQRAVAAGVLPLEASQVKHNAILPNTGFFGNHPRLSGAIEGGLFGAMAAHGGTTPGESIQGAIEGIVGGQQMRSGILRQQFARPFEAAGALERLSDMKQRRELQDADIQHLRALNEHLANGDDLAAQRLTETNRHQEIMEGAAQSRIEATAPRNLGGGLYGFYNPPPQGGIPGRVPESMARGVFNAANPNQKGDWSIQENPESRTGRQAAGAGPWYSSRDAQGNETFGRVREGTRLPKGARLVQGSYDEKQTTSQGNSRDKWIKDNQKMSEANAGVWMAAGVGPGDKDAAKKLATYYDSNIAPYLRQQGGPPEGQAGDLTYDPATGRAH